MNDNSLQDFQNKMDKVLDVLREDLSTIRTGRATPAMIADMLLSVYDGSASLKLEELATITTEDAATLVVVPFDKTIIKEIEKGLRSANLGMSVISDDDRIRLKVSPLTEQRREEFVTLAKKKIEGARIMARQVRKEAMQQIKRQHESEEISEDEKFSLEKKVQEIVDKVMETIKEIGERKEKEIRSI